MNLSVAVIHYPVYNKNREIIATSVTGIEIHDCARTCMTFNVNLCYIVTPLEKQREIIEKMREHWVSGYGFKYNPLRAQALSIVRTAPSLEKVLSELKELDPGLLVVGTSAKRRESKNLTYEEFYEMLTERKISALLLFGTGWGLTDDTVSMCDRMLEPISGLGNYNHLSMRVAMGIILDRIFNPRGGKK
ncbi:MAG: RNA methyltransferase [Desulfobacterota bacterium]|nr:RNA methyltransferase [Thermodesulfobacteriota bacterium]MDW8001838.1 RNA methyltransferase [Deltaproteobacteria bacterium]